MVPSFDASRRGSGERARRSNSTARTTPIIVAPDAYDLPDGPLTLETWFQRRRLRPDGPAWPPGREQRVRHLRERRHPGLQRPPRRRVRDGPSGEPVLEPGAGIISRASSTAPRSGSTSTDDSSRATPPPACGPGTGSPSSSARTTWKRGGRPRASTEGSTACGSPRSPGTTATPSNARSTASPGRGHGAPPRLRRPSGALDLGSITQPRLVGGREIRRTTLGSWPRDDPGRLRYFGHGMTCDMSS